MKAELKDICQSKNTDRSMGHDWWKMCWYSRKNRNFTI